MITPHPDDVTLNDYADGTLPGSQQRVVEVHLLSCSSCRDVVDSLRRVRTAVRQLPPISPPRHVWTRLERSLRARGATRASARWQWLAAAAALIVAVLGGMKLADLDRKSVV